MKPEDFIEDAVHKLFDQGLVRRDSHSGPKYTSNALERDAKAAGYSATASTTANAPLESGHPQLPFDLDKYVPFFPPFGMPPREFAGPHVGDAQLFPLKAISLFVSLGGVGKTSSLIAIAAHIAAGKQWGQSRLTKRKALMFFVEEDQNELNRKFGAITQNWDAIDRDMAIQNLRLISCVDRDPRLTRPEGRSIEPTGLAEQIINSAKDFDAELIVSDHLQGFAGGDLNNSDTATGLSLEANVMVSETGAAVVFTAHTNKSQMAAQNVENGFTTGSLAFENAARQVTGAISLPDEDAKKFGLEANRKDYIKLEMPKNSYGKAGEHCYLRKNVVPDFHTVAVIPFEAGKGSIYIDSPEERLRQKVHEYIRDTPCISKNKLEGMSGKKGTFKASKADVRKTLESLIADGAVTLIKPSKAQRDKYVIPSQATEVLVCHD